MCDLTYFLEQFMSNQSVCISLGMTDPIRPMQHPVWAATDLSTAACHNMLNPTYCCRLQESGNVSLTDLPKPAPVVLQPGVIPDCLTPLHTHAPIPLNPTSSATAATSQPQQQREKGRGKTLLEQRMNERFGKVALKQQQMQEKLQQSQQQPKAKQQVWKAIKGTSAAAAAKPSAVVATMPVAAAAGMENPAVTARAPAVAALRTQAAATALTKTGSIAEAASSVVAEKSDSAVAAVGKSTEQAKPTHEAAAPAVAVTLTIKERKKAKHALEAQKRRARQLAAAVQGGRKKAFKQ